MATLAETPAPIQKAYPDPSKVKDVLVHDNESGGETYTVRLYSGRMDTWARKSFWWRCVRQSFSQERKVKR